MSHQHPCVDCGGVGHLPLVYETGEMYGWVCDRCEQKRRRARLGWKRRVSLRVRHWLKL